MKLALPVLVILLTAPRAGGQPVSRCLPVEAGQSVSSLVDSEKFKSLMGAGWSLDSANIEISRLVITLKAEPDLRLGVVLSESGPGEVRGRWFSYEYFSSQGPPTEREIEMLLALASQVDQAFQASPWVACLEAAEGPGAPPDEFSVGKSSPSPTSSTLYPTGLYVLLGFLQLLVLFWGLGAALWNRTPPPVRKRP